MKLDFCAVCGSKEDLHLHHIDPIIHTSENRKSFKYDANKPIKDCTPREIFNALFDRGFISEHATLTLCSWHHRIMHGIVTFQKVNSSELIKEGLAKAKSEGKTLGRPSTINGEQGEEIRKKIMELRNSGNSIRKICKTIKIGVGTYYEVMGYHEESKRIENAKKLLQKVQDSNLSKLPVSSEKPKIKYTDFINQNKIS